jgi:small subunit ribosomal protein S11
MGKKRIIKKGADAGGDKQPAPARESSKKKLSSGIIHILSTYNNTLITLTDEQGNVYMSQTSGRSGFSGSKKGTPYAASRAAEVLAERAREIGLSDIQVRVKGVGSGRESALRVFAQKGFNIHSIKDMTPLPHGHVRSVKPRRV